MKPCYAGLCAAVCLLLALPAGADEQPQKQVNVSLDGGIGGYTGDLSNSLSAGPVWGLRLGFQPLTMLGIEFAYEGSHNAVSGTAGSLNRNGMDAMMKLSPPFMHTVRPFVGAGIGASYVSSTARGLMSDLMEEVPVAAGIEFNSPDFTAGFRTTYRFLIDNQITPTGNNPGGLFDAAVTLGGRF